MTKQQNSPAEGLYIVPEGKTSIRSSSIPNPESLTAIRLPNTLRTICSYTFSKCPTLTEITVPDSVETLETRAFFKCAALRKVILPKNLRSIPDLSFFECLSLTNITIPETVTEIGELAFSHCQSLKRITLPASVQKIGDSLFWGCSSLEEVIFSPGIEEIPDGTFLDCENLRRIVIPDTVQKINSNAFENCPSLREVILSPNHPYFQMIGNFLLNRKGNRLIRVFCGPDLATVPHTVSTVARKAVSGKAHPKILILPAGLTHFPKGRFVPPLSLMMKGAGGNLVDMNPLLLSADQFPDKLLTQIPIQAIAAFPVFSSPEKKEKLALRFAKIYCSRQFRIPPQLVEKAKTFFRNHKKQLTGHLETLTFLTDQKLLTRTDIPDLLRQYAEEGQVPLSALLLDYQHKYFADDPFNEKQMEKQMQKELLFATEGKIQPIDAKKLWRFRTLPDGGIRITAYIGKDTEVTVPTFIGKHPVTEIGTRVFSPYANEENAKTARMHLTSVTIPEGVVRIGRESFWACCSLTSVSLPDSVTEIQTGAFASCTALPSLRLPAHLSELSDAVFYNCMSLQKITLPDTLTAIDNYVFQLCSSLTELEIPDSVTKIGAEVFEQCPSLTLSASPGSAAARYAEKNGISLKK